MSLKKFIEKHGNSFSFPVTLASADLPEMPLIFVNDSFLALSGYNRKDILGINCRFLQKGKTPDEIRSRMRESFALKEPLCQDLVNFKLTGEKFFNRLVMLPFRESGSRYVLGLQHEIPEEKFRPQTLVTGSELMDKTINPISILMGLDMRDDQRFPAEFEKAIKKLRDYVLSL